VKDKIPLNIAVVTVSDTRTEENDKSGSVLVSSLEKDGHRLHSKHIVKDDVYDLRKIISGHIADSDVNVVLTTGGTGFTGRDNTQKALQLLFDLHIEGFGELFRQLSYEEISTSTVQSRAFAGLANGTIIFCVPGSPGACKTGWDMIIRDQLDSSHKPCNFVDKLAF
jgi:molybdenum cofactor biosynthesis protein B